MKKIFIFGPPCVGKTTLSHTALKHKIPSFSTHGTTRQNREEVFTYIINLNIQIQPYRKSYKNLTETIKLSLFYSFLGIFHSFYIIHVSPNKKAPLKRGFFNIR